MPDVIRHTAPAVLGRSTPWLPYVAPFAAYMLFVVLDGGLQEISQLDAHWRLWLYPLKIATVVALLWHYRRHYPELAKAAWQAPGLILGVGVGVAVFALWINMDWAFATLGESHGYNPAASLTGGSAIGLLSIRLMGAALVVPLFEELFWRGFLMRYLVHPRFEQVALGRFTAFSFIGTAVLFGVEHHLWLAGIMAGVAYGTLLCRTRSLPAVVVAHGVTNLLLGIWVMATGNWQFW